MIHLLFHIAIGTCLYNHGEWLALAYGFLILHTLYASYSRRISAVKNVKIYSMDELNKLYKEENKVGKPVKRSEVNKRMDELIKRMEEHNSKWLEKHDKDSEKD